MIYFFRILLVIIFSAAVLFPQVKKDEVIAAVDNEDITVSDFKKRFELSPFISPKYDRFETDSLKADFLYSIIAEKIWASEALKHGTENTLMFRFVFRPLREMILRDALFRRQVESKINVTDSDLKNAVKKYNSAVSVKIISSVDSAVIYGIYKKMKGSSNADSLVKNDPGINKLLSEREIRFGDLRDEKLEESLFNLNPGSYLPPFKHEQLWVIFFSSGKTISAADISDQKVMSDISRRIKNRRLEKAHNNYLDSLLGGYTYNADREIFMAAAEKLIPFIQAMPDTQKDLYITEEQYFSLINSEDELLTKELFKAGDRSFTVFDFFSSLSFEEFKTSSKAKDQILNSLGRRIKIHIQQQLLVNEAVKLGLENLPEVRKDLNTWREHYLSHMYKTSFKDSVRIQEDDVYNYYLEKIKKGDLKLVNLAMVTTGNLEIVESILNRLKAGETFLKIAEEFGRTDDLINEKGITGLISILELGDLGAIVNSVKEGEVYGPVKRAGGYSILQLLEKKKMSDSSVAAFQNVKSGLRSELFNNKLNDLLTRKTAGFVKSHNIRINKNVLSKTEVNTIPVFVHRLMGFGGRIAGVPFTTSFSDWVEEVDKETLYP